MKELSIEEKAKAYDKAIERAKAYQGLRSEMEIIFPELKESEDVRIRKAIIATIHLYYGEPLEDEAKEMIAWLEKKPSLLTKEKALKNSPFVEQKSSWSEEDEKMLECAIDMIEWYSVVDKSKSKRVSDWLKFLRPQKQWKPSEEQMKALEDAIEFLGCTKKVRNDLKSLYEQLKKLREK
jgi:hypothetical protein